MASFAQLASIGLIAGRPIIDNSDVIYDKAKTKVQKVKRRQTTRIYEDGSQDDKKRAKKNNNDDDDDKGPPRPRGGSGGRARSVGNYDPYYSDEDDEYYRRSRGNNRNSNQRRSEPRYDEGYDSEGSVPPKNRQMVSSRGGNQSMTQYGKSRYANSQPPYTTKSENDRDSSSDDSTSTSDLMDSEEDERQEKKKRRNEMLTGGIAAVATLNAAANVYNSMKARELRIKELAEGTITQEEAKKQRYKHHMQDAATIGLAALTVKGAYAKWQGAANKHRETKAHKEERKRRQEKRIQKGISRKNHDHERAAAAQKGRLAPGYEDTARANRPGYNRGHSYEYEDLPSPGYQQDRGYAQQAKRSYGRSRWEHGPYGAPGRRGHDEADMYNGADEALAGYSHDA